MKCAKSGRGGAMHRFRPKHLVGACFRTGSDVLIQLDEPGWKQIGLMCGTCGYKEFYAQEPQEALACGEEFLECTEPVNPGRPGSDAGPAGKEARQ